MKESPSFQPSEKRIEGTPLLSTSRDKKISEIRRDISQSLEKHPEYIPHELENPKVSVQKIPEMGRAVFAREPIHAGEIIAAFVGTVHRAKKISELPNDPPDYMRDHVIQIGEEEYLHGKGGLAELINHSCDPNCGIKDLSKVVAMRDIKAGEQLTWDYAMTEDSDWYFPGCLCGSEACRGTIGPYRDIPKERKEKYRDFTSEWLRKKYPMKETSAEILPTYSFQNLHSESPELTDEIIQEISDFFLWIFANEFAGQYLFYPTEGKPIPPHIVFGKQKGAFISLKELKAFDPKAYPKHPTTGEHAVFWIDPEVTFRRFQEKFKKNAHITLLRKNKDQTLAGFIFGHRCTLREAFSSEEWENPHYYSSYSGKQHWRSFEVFQEKINQALQRYPEKFAPLLGEKKCLEADDPVYVWNCFALTPEARRQGKTLEMTREFFSQIPKEMKEQLIELGEPLFGSQSHHMMRTAGAIDIPGFLKQGDHLNDGDPLLIAAPLSEFAETYSLNRESFRKKAQSHGKT